MERPHTGMVDRFPAPFYNYAILPEVTERDAFWTMKTTAATAADDGRPETVPVHYEPFTVPKNTPFGMFIAGFALAFGFAMVWHMWWLAAVGLLGVIISIIIRTTDDNTERQVTVAEIEKVEAEIAARKQYV